MRSTRFVAALIMAAASVAAAATPTDTAAVGRQSPSEVPVKGTVKSHGCYSSSGTLAKIDQLEFPAMGSCTGACKAINKLVSALHASDCWCGDAYPPKSASVADGKCSYPCPFYPQEACGGIDDGEFFSVFNNGIKVDVQDSDAKPSSSTGANGSSSTSAAPTATVTQTSAPSSGPNVGGIAAGVVVSLLAVAAIVGGVFFYLRRKRNREVEDEQRRNATMNAFINGGKPPSSSGGLSMTDSRMDPVMAHRRLSDGSIADNQDYSRKILRVTNA